MASATPSIQTLIDALIAREGDYVDHPADRGGPTRWGITQAVARQHGWQGSMRDFPRERAGDIYRRIYWREPGYDLIAPIAPRIAAELFDTAVNMGPKVASLFLQRALNALNRGATDYPDLALDGEAGPKTRAALGAFIRDRGPAGERVLLKAMEALQGERYVRLAEERPANEAFLYGWLAHRIGQDA